MEPIVIEGGKGTVELENNEVIQLRWKPKVRIEAADAQAAMAAVNTIAQESEYPMLVDMTTTESLSRHARSVFTIPCAASRIALLGTSPVDRILANWSLSVQNLPCPARFFTSRTEAMKWLFPYACWAGGRLHPYAEGSAGSGSVWEIIAWTGKARPLNRHLLPLPHHLRIRL